jgi:hypothetical protein
VSSGTDWYEIRPWHLPDSARCLIRVRSALQSRRRQEQHGPILAAKSEVSRFSVCPNGLTASRIKPNEQANSALICMTKFFIVLIALAFAVLIGAFVFAAFTL